jgi:SAM-dependent methyltransferase
MFGLFRRARGKPVSGITAGQVVSLIDHNFKFQRIRSRFAVDAPGLAAEKYLNYQAYIPVYHRDMVVLGLDAGPKLRILDLGTGFGYYPFICSCFGHEAEAVDIDTLPLYNEVTTALGVKRTVCRIEAFTPMPLDRGRFDLVMAFATCFNNNSSPDLWGQKEWAFFLKDLVTNHLTEDGRLFFRINPESDGRMGSTGVEEMMNALGAEVSGIDVHFRSARDLAAALEGFSPR